jgi:hypothetical protein
MWEAPKSRTEAAESGGKWGIAMVCRRVNCLVIPKERVGVNGLLNYQ